MPYRAQAEVLLLTMGLLAAPPAVGPFPQVGQLYVLVLENGDGDLEPLFPHVGQYAEDDAFDDAFDVAGDELVFCGPQVAQEKESVRPV